MSDLEYRSRGAQHQRRDRRALRGSCVDGVFCKAVSRSNSCRPALKRGMAGSIADKFIQNDIGCQVQGITEI